ncbi:hypothetical protein MNBD_GAMMA11-3472 [hydrothermal vent metagenome]|uniref:Uncharacterized protein n=1 Tax=hydrothermal vent metagenome TaxID=652676 RepID=A0A3B0YCL2_9ZZZZ
MKKIDPKNKTAQFNYRATGNPPSTVPDTAISNCFPGLEFDFRNVWRRIFAGITLHEANTRITSIEDPALNELTGYSLIRVEGNDVNTMVTGPTQVGGTIRDLRPGQLNQLEWSNSLADIISRAGTQVRCTFENSAGNTITRDLMVRDVFDAQSDSALSRELLEPGELTQSLCSPWQNDYKECACYYWAASRPDFVNTEQNAQGETVGNNWFEKNRTPATPANYTLRSGELVSYEEMFQNWEQELKFIIEGNDEDR